jgi:diguanylate cyclase (GGDEF)-like protein/PAS domain S-box-containing protein
VSEPVNTSTQIAALQQRIRELTESDGRLRKATFVADITHQNEQEEELRRLRAALDASADAIYLVDTSTMTFLDVNDAATAMLKYSQEELLTMGPGDIDVQVPREELERRFQKMISPSDARQAPFQTTHRSRDGALIPVEMQTSLYRWSDKEIVIGIARDITARIRTESELRRVNRELDQLVKERTSSLSHVNRELQLMNSVVESSLNGVAITDTDGVVQQVNASFCLITGYQQHEIVGKKTNILKSGRHDEVFYQKMWAKLVNTGEWQGEIWNRRKTGEVYPEWLTLRAIYDTNGEITNYVAVFHDLTELRAKEEEVEFQTNFDALTGLPNRLSFLERIDSALRHARRNDQGVAVALADIDDFRKINETIGHTGGDTFLEQFAALLRETIGDRATVARLGGDEFGLLMEGITDQWDYASITEEISSLSENPLEIGDASVTTTVSIGVSVFPDDGDQADILLNNAEVAMYQVKERVVQEGSGRVGMFTAALDEALRRRISLESQLRHDLREGRIVPFYQPRVDLTSGGVIGAEALARWIREDGTVVSPAEFIPLAEETNLIVPLGELLLQNIRKDIEGPLQPYIDELRLSFNASVKEIRNPAFLDRLSATFNTDSLTRTMEIELTESIIMDDMDTTMPVLHGIKKRGLTLAIDDFGTGYSSLYYLKRLPIDVLKIDKSFVDEVATDPNDQAIVATIIAMGHALNLDLVAEGIETEDQRAFLVDRGCTEGQGFLYGRPMDPGAFVEYLQGIKVEL